jgi:sterol desaturase/sphingolipid hydroxylase (fatty acid hydroxylase superfamily)
MDALAQVGLGIVGLLGSPAVSIYWLYLLTAGVLAVAVYVWHTRRRATLRGAVAFVLPRQILGHRSTRHDLALFVLNTLIHSFVFVAVLHGLSSWLARATWGALQHGLGPIEAPITGWPLVLGTTVVVFVMADLAFFVAHLLLHKIPVLWELHKVHHSAPVLTPLSVFRRHPGDIFFDGAVSGVVLGVTYGILGWLGGQLVPGYAVLGVNALLFTTLLIGFNLQHSHVWLRFGVLERVLISPAAHQLHHSDAPEHFDHNFGNMLSVWDRLLGTYIAPRPRPEHLRFGLGPETARYDSLIRLYAVPVLRILSGNVWRARGTDRAP